MYLAVEKYSSIMGSIFDDTDIQGSLIVLYVFSYSYFLRKSNNFIETLR